MKYYMCDNCGIFTDRNTVNLNGCPSCGKEGIEIDKKYVKGAEQTINYIKQLSDKIKELDEDLYISKIYNDILFLHLKILGALLSKQKNFELGNYVYNIRETFTSFKDIYNNFNKIKD